jgi:hypothetical protein
MVYRIDFISQTGAQLVPGFLFLTVNSFTFSMYNINISIIGGDYMKNVLELFFNKLSCEKGEDIFEYGFGSYSEVSYANWLLENKHISKEKYEEIMYDDMELFQIISEVDEEDYEFCLAVFAEYVTNTFSDGQIADLLMAFFE